MSVKVKDIKTKMIREF